MLYMNLGLTQVLSKSAVDDSDNELDVSLMTHVGCSASVFFVVQRRWGGVGCSAFVRFVEC